MTDFQDVEESKRSLLRWSKPWNYIYRDMNKQVSLSSMETYYISNMMGVGFCKYRCSCTYLLQLLYCTLAHCVCSVAQTQEVNRHKMNHITKWPLDAICQEKFLHLCHSKNLVIFLSFIKKMIIWNNACNGCNPKLFAQHKPKTNNNNNNLKKKTY